MGSDPIRPTFEELGAALYTERRRAERLLHQSERKEYEEADQQENGSEVDRAVPEKNEAEACEEQA